MKDELIDALRALMVDGIEPPDELLLRAAKLCPIATLDHALGQIEDMEN